MTVGKHRRASALRFVVALGALATSSTPALAVTPFSCQVWLGPPRSAEETQTLVLRVTTVVDEAIRDVAVSFLSEEVIEPGGLSARLGAIDAGGSAEATFALLLPASLDASWLADAEPRCRVSYTDHNGERITEVRAAEVAVPQEEH